MDMDVETEMDMDITEANLLFAFGQPGCPVCYLRQEMEGRHLQTLLAEYVNDGHTRMVFGRSQGLCAFHAWFLQATEQSIYEDGFKTAILYESLATVVHDAMRRYLARGADRPRPSHLRAWLERSGRLGRWLADAISPTMPAASLLAELSPSIECPVCTRMRELQAMNVAKLVQDMNNDRFRAAFAASDGLCLPHLRQALACTSDPEAAYLLIMTAERQLGTLLGHLREYQNKHRWTHHPELRTASENASWIRSVAFFAGEALESDNDLLQQLRRQALKDYHLHS